MTDVWFHPAAELEMLEAMENYELARPGLGDDFLKAIDEAQEQLRAYPNGWARPSGNIRRYRLRRFSYGSVYQIRDEVICILAVMHLNRRPGYWRPRLDQR